MRTEQDDNQGNTLNDDDRYAMPPTLPVRRFIVRRDINNHDDYRVEIDGHRAVTDNGVLTIERIVGNGYWTVRGFAAGEWDDFEAEVPTVESMQEFNKAVDEWQTRQNELSARIQAGARTAAAGATQGPSPLAHRLTRGPSIN